MVGWLKPLTDWADQRTRRNRWKPIVHYQRDCNISTLYPKSTTWLVGSKVPQASVPAYQRTTWITIKRQNQLFTFFSWFAGSVSNDTGFVTTNQLNDNTHYFLERHHLFVKTDQSHVTPGHLRQLGMQVVSIIGNRPPCQHTNNKTSSWWKRIFFLTIWLVCPKVMQTELTTYQSKWQQRAQKDKTKCSLVCYNLFGSQHPGSDPEDHLPKNKRQSLSHIFTGIW